MLLVFCAIGIIAVAYTVYPQGLPAQSIQTDGKQVMLLDDASSPFAG
jgi:hypothetical protein